MSLRHFLAPALLLVAGCGSARPAGPKVDARITSFLSDVFVTEAGDQVVVLDTAKGLVAIEFLQKRAPVTGNAIAAHVRGGTYDGAQFLRVERGFIVQVGDPNRPDAAASTVPLEVNPALSNRTGMVGLARPEDDINGGTSKFYILLSDHPELDAKYAVFGRVLKGMDVVERIELGDVINRAHLVDGLPVAGALERNEHRTS